MTVAYIDTSCLVAVAFDEPGASQVARRLDRYDRLLASNLLEAELRSSLVREEVEERADALLSWISWIYPNRPLSPEFRRIAGVGSVKGADMWHLAHALFLAPDGKGIDFLTLDRRQGDVAAALGFKVKM